MTGAVRRAVRVGVSVAGAFAILASTAPAHACGACVCFDARTVVPVYTNNDVPLNARFFLTLTVRSEAGTRAIDPATIRLATFDQDVDVPFRLEPSGGKPDEFWLIPSNPLQPNTVYRIADVATDLQRFQTNSKMDTDVPVLGAVSITSGGSGAMCPTFLGAQLSIASMADASIPGQQTIVQVHVTGANIDQMLFLPASLYTQPQTLEFGASTDPAAQACLLNSALDHGEAGSALSATVTVYDWAGNSATSEAIPFELGATEPGGCGGPIPGPDAGVIDAGANSDDATTVGGGCAIASSAPMRGIPGVVLGILAALLGRRRHVRSRRPT